MVNSRKLALRGFILHLLEIPQVQGFILRNFLAPPDEALETSAGAGQTVSSPVVLPRASAKQENSLNASGSSMHGLDPRGKETSPAIDVAVASRRTPSRRDSLHDGPRANVKRKLDFHDVAQSSGSSPHTKHGSLGFLDPQTLPSV